jgi:hypothetical protein
VDAARRARRAGRGAQGAERVMSREPDLGADVGGADLHSGTVLSVRAEGDVVRVLLRGLSGRRYDVRFDGVDSVWSNRPEWMLIRGLFAADAAPPRRRFRFANLYHETGAYLDVVASGFVMAERDVLDAAMPYSACYGQTVRVGKPVVLECPSPTAKYSVVFEDDGDTGYFYGLDLSLEGPTPIVDAVHIYDVKQVTDRKKPCAFEVIWSKDGLKAGLLINGYMHAVFDFEARKGWCRTGFPPGSTYTPTHHWDDAALAHFKP